MVKKIILLVGCVMVTGAVRSTEKTALVVAGQAVQKTSASDSAQRFRESMRWLKKREMSVTEKQFKCFLELMCFLVTSEGRVGIRSSL